MKKCRDCKEIKQKTEFIRNHTFHDGIDTLCLVCNRKRVYAWRKAGNRRSAEESARYTKRHPEKVGARHAKHRAKRKNAVPSWLHGGDWFMIEEAYHLAKLRTKIFGFTWHVDHIIPLCGENVCGLHVPTNLQVIPGKTNMLKSNKFVGY